MADLAGGEVLEGFGHVCPRDYLNLWPWSIAHVERLDRDPIYIAIHAELPAPLGPAEVWLRILEDQSSMPMVYHRVKFLYNSPRNRDSCHSPPQRYGKMMDKAVPFGSHSMAIKVSVRVPDEILVFVRGTHPLLYLSVTVAPYYLYDRLL